MICAFGEQATLIPETLLYEVTVCICFYKNLGKKKNCNLLQMVNPVIFSEEHNAVSEVVGPVCSL